MANEPIGAPICWGKQYEDGSDECNNCPYNDSCRPVTINLASRRGNGAFGSHMPPYLPLPTTTPRFGFPGSSSLPQPSSYPRTMGMSGSIPSMPVPVHGVPHAPSAPVAFQPHAPAGWNNPFAYLPRPSPNGMWWQYQDETTKSRLGKNVMLGIMQALFGELFRFFSTWTWPEEFGRRGPN